MPSSWHKCSLMSCSCSNRWLVQLQCSSQHASTTKFLQEASSQAEAASLIGSLAKEANEPCLYLVRGLRSEGAWTLISYADDSKHAAKDRMVMASVKESVREQLGNSQFSRGRRQIRFGFYCRSDLAQMQMCTQASLLTYTPQTF